MPSLRQVVITGFVLAAVAGVLVATSAGAGTSTGVGRVVASVPIPAGTGGFAVGSSAVWAVSDTGPVVSRIDARRNEVVASIPVKLNHACPAAPPGCGEVAAGAGALWMSHVTDDTVTRIDHATNRLTATIKVGHRPLDVAVGAGGVWVANSAGPSVSRIDPATNRVVATIKLGPRSAASDRMTITAAVGAVWVTLTKRYALLRIDPARNAVVATIKLAWMKSGQPCGFIAAQQSTVWAAGAHCAASSGYGVVTQFDKPTNMVERVVAGFKAPIGLAVGFGSLWVADLDAKSIVRVDPATGKIVGRLHVGGQPIRIEAGFGSLWVRDDGGRVLRIDPAP
jgi:YVTN family beta-propeller protein